MRSPELTLLVSLSSLPRGVLEAPWRRSSRFCQYLALTSPSRQGEGPAQAWDAILQVRCSRVFAARMARRALTACRPDRPGKTLILLLKFTLMYYRMLITSARRHQTKRKSFTNKSFTDFRLCTYICSAETLGYPFPPVY